MKPDKTRDNPFSENSPPNREPIPAKDTIRRQNQHVPRYQDGGREANKGTIEKRGGDLQRDEVDYTDGNTPDPKDR